MDTVILLCFLLGFSVLLNIFLLVSNRKKKQKNESYEVRELIHDLTAGAGLVEVRRIAPENFFLRSPRR